MRVVAMDLETHPIQPGMLTPKAVVLSYYENGMSKGELIVFPQAAAWMAKQLLDPNIALVGHNVAFDLGVCCVEDPNLLPLVFSALEQGRIRDTMVRGKLIDIGRGEHKYKTRDDGVRIRTSHSLAAMAKLYCNLDLQKVDTYRTRYHELDGIPLGEWPAEARDYAEKDAKVTLQVYEAQEKFAWESPLWKGPITNEVEQTRAAFVLHLMAVWGVITDGDRVAALKARLLEQLDGADEFLQKAGLVHQTGSKKNPKWSKDTKVIKARIEAGYQAQGKRIPQTDGGQTSTSADAKRGSGDPDLIRMAGFALAETLIDSFIPLLERGTKTPICARFNVLVESGRISCSDPNLLNPPAGDEGIREAFVARPGYVFIDADYSVVEYRAWAQIHLDLFKRSSLADVFRKGGDPHSNLLRSMNIDPDSYLEINGVKIPARAFAKMINFGLMSGMGCDTLIEYAKGYGITITDEQAEAYKQQWLGVIPEAKPYFQWASRQVPNGNKGTIRQLRSGRIRGGCGFTQAVNTQPQGLTADGAKEALWLISKECYLDPSSGLYGSRPVIHLYDENMIEAPEHKATEAAARLVQLMEIGMGKYIPDVPIVVSKPVVMKHWSKNAKSDMVDGKLITWDVEDGG